VLTNISSRANRAQVPAPSVAHVGLTDPALMETHFKQQNIPLWDTERIVESRNDHPAWMHEHFAYETLVSGEEREVDKGPGEPASQPQATLATTAKHPHPYFYFPGKP
jgi:hypothetical protein